MIHFLEFGENKWHYWSYYTLLVMVQQTFLMLALRSHYSIDMLAGGMIAHYIWLLTNKYVTNASSKK